MEVASLQPQNVASRFEQKDPLDKYSHGVTTPVHDAYPGSAYARIKQEVINEWRKLEGETLLVIPFESDAEKPELHNDVGDRIFNAVREIIQSKDYGVASPMKKEDLEMLLSKQRGQSTGQKRQWSSERLPTTFLIHSLSQVHYQILMQQTVWASQIITFRVTPPEMTCPSFLFAIKGLRTNSLELVRECVQDTWNDEITTTFFQNGVAATKKTNVTMLPSRYRDSKSLCGLKRLKRKDKAAFRNPPSMYTQMATSSTTPMPGRASEFT